MIQYLIKNLKNIFRNLNNLRLNVCKNIFNFLINKYLVIQSKSILCIKYQKLINYGV